MKRLLRKYKNIYHWVIGLGYVVRFGWPAQSLKIIAVTGTDGKTTTCHLVYEVLKKAGKKVALVSTVAAFIGEEEIDTGFHVTNPDARVLQKLLRKIVDMGFEYLVLEVTSHGIDQNRLVGVTPMIGVITNITHEHLDYHGDFEDYRATKARLVVGTKYAVLNSDDPSTDWIRSRCGGEVVEYGKLGIKTSGALVGDYNQYNLGAVAAVARILNVEYRIIEEVAKTFAGVSGRMEEINVGQKFRAVVDFAHTPNALENVLRELKSQKAKGKSDLILVFGCAGLRDHTKRPKMGKIAVTLADKVIVTAEDPRTESLDDIYSDITSGLPATPSYDKRGRGGDIFREDDRQKAIEMAVKMAKPGDIVVVTGKGHEKSMCFGAKEYPWSDREAVKKAIGTIL